MKELSKRSAHFTDSVIRRMTRISNQYDAINLSQGFPDCDPPKELTNQLSTVATKGPHQYAVTWGADNFREALAKKQKHFTGQSVDPDREVVVTCGSTEAMMAAMMAVVNPGEQVIIFSPFYENYGADTILSGAVPVYIPLKPPTFTFDAEQLKSAFQKGAKALILCNPSNPCGKVFTKEELTIIAELAIQFDAYVITDEVYEHIIYEPYHHEYIATYPGMKERTIVCSSLSKTYSITGWRLGYAIGPESVIDRIKKVHDFLTVGAAAPLMEAAVIGLLLPDSYYDQLQQEYTQKRNLFLSGLKEFNLTITEPMGAYYTLLDISEFGYKSDYEFCIDMAKEIKVGAVPGSSFFHEPVNNLVRLHFAKGEETLKKALDRMSDLKRLKK